MISTGVVNLLEGPNSNNNNNVEVLKEVASIGKEHHHQGFRHS